MLVGIKNFRLCLDLAIFGASRRRAQKPPSATRTRPLAVRAVRKLLHHSITSREEKRISPRPARP